jgi:hypothetical protein
VEDRIVISSKGKTLAELGELLNGLCEAELLIPAGHAREVVALQSTETTVAEVIAQLGLVVDRPAKHNPITERTSEHEITGPGMGPAIVHGYATAPRQIRQLLRSLIHTDSCR